MDIRPYEPRDRAPCIEVFNSLTPTQLNRAALPELESWLDQPAGPFFVMEHDEAITGCGGYSFSPDQTSATLQWGMVHRRSQRMGLGRYLLLYRIREIGRRGTAGIVLARSPQASASFYEKQGFRVNRIEIDRVELIMKLTVCP
jgi:GNAT superfamily N-acetyltransferase